MRLRPEVTIRLAREPVDFRKSIDGLAVAVGRALGRDPLGGELFLFRNRSGSALKALYWTPNGFVMVYKRLERGRFSLPDVDATTADVVLPVELLQDLLDGVSRSAGTARS